MFDEASRELADGGQQYDLTAIINEVRRAGKKPESQAEATSRFQTLEGALACLMQDFNVTGLNAQNDDQLRML